MRILFLAAEAAPLVKVGGLADVAGELPGALRRLGLDVQLALPFYPLIDRRSMNAQKVTTIQVEHRRGPQQAEVWRTELGGVPILLIDGDPVRRSQPVYAGMPLDAEKFAFFAVAALMAVEALGWKPDVVHANDWHAAPAAVWLARRRQQSSFWDNVVSLLTVHNLPYTGAGGEGALADYGFRPSEDPRLPLWARSQPLPMGLSAADWLSTVSPTYAQEIQTAEFGCGLEGLLQARADRLVGILNGIDPEGWNPATDPALPAHFNAAELAPRAQVRAALLQELGLPPDAAVPLLGMVTRLDFQKGVDIALEALDEIADVPWRFILLGTGDPGLEDKARRFARSHTGRAHAVLRFDTALARRIYGGSDLILVPSRYEPCGLAQMIGMRYGSVPLVRATGGLRDTVQPYVPGKGGTGFHFEQPDPKAMAVSLRHALKVFADKRSWRPLQRRAMRRDFSWNRSAAEYRSLYERALAGRKA